MAGGTEVIFPIVLLHPTFLIFPYPLPALPQISIAYLRKWHSIYFSWVWNLHLILLGHSCWKFSFTILSGLRSIKIRPSDSPGSQTYSILPPLCHGKHIQPYISGLQPLVRIHSHSCFPGFCWHTLPGPFISLTFRPFLPRAEPILLCLDCDETWLAWSQWSILGTDFIENKHYLLRPLLQVNLVHSS